MNRFIWRLSLFIMLFLLLAPLAVLFVWSIAQSWPWPQLFPSALGMRGFSYFADPLSQTGKLLLDSITLSAVVTAVTLAVSVPAAKALGCWDFRGKNAIRLFLLMPLIVPSLSVAMGIHTAFMGMGLANRFWGVVLIHLVCGIPYAVRILSHVFELIGERHENQARVLGASPLQALIHVTLPMIAPGMASAASMVFIVSFSQYFLTFFIGGGRIVTLPMVMLPYVQSGDRMMASVYSLCFIAVTLSVLLVLEYGLKRFYSHSGHHYLSDL